MQKSAPARDPFPLSDLIDRGSDDVILAIQTVDHSCLDMSWVVRRAMLLHDQIELELLRLEIAEPQSRTWIGVARPSTMFKDSPGVVRAPEVRPARELDQEPDRLGQG